MALPVQVKTRVYLDQLSTVSAVLDGAKKTAYRHCACSTVLFGSSSPVVARAEAWCETLEEHHAAASALKTKAEQEIADEMGP
jgi:hypothetical protein